MIQPLVTCLCPTKNRRPWLPQAIRCFQRQTYGNKRMLIVADGSDVSDLVPDEDSRVTLVTLKDSPATLGDKRNVACDLVDTPIIVHWDDDDWSAPGRVSDQVARLQDSGKQVTGYRSMLFTNGAAWWKYEGYPGFAFGTSLCYFRDWWKVHPFPSVNHASDVCFANGALQADQMISVPAHGRMVARDHRAITNQIRLHGRDENQTWRRAARAEAPLAFEWDGPT